MKDDFRTLERPAEHREKIERSEFLAIAFPAPSETAFMAELDAIRKRHFDATHHCWAFRLFADERARSSDAGEPSGSAGKQILSAIESADLFDTAVVVVRWFGGVKLGTGGLSRAYRNAAAGALADAAVVERYIYRRVDVIIPFDRVSDAYRLVDPPSVVLADEEYGERNLFHYDVRATRADEFVRRLMALRFTLP